MSYKARFNRIYRQDAKKSNTFAEIAVLSGINESKLVRRYNDIIKYPYTYGYDAIDKPLELEQFARIGVYKYAIDCRIKGPILK